jgi:HAD superfamily hydrolase (TIGR01490 family)
MLVVMRTPDSDAGHDEHAPTPAPVLAFFDVDNTLVRGATIYHLGKAAFNLGYLGWRDLARFAWQQARFIRVGENHRHQLRARDRALELVAGRTEAELQKLSAQTYDGRVVHLLLPATLALTRKHLAQGHEVWLITATPDTFAAVIAQRLGLTGAIGTRVEAIDGVFTGALQGHVMHGRHKADAAAQLALERGARLTDCFAYSDSRNDIPLLELVGHQTVVNPDAALLRYATARSWPVVRTRL